MLLATRSWLPVSDPPPAWVTVSPLADAEWEEPYTQALLASGASAYVIASGSLPPGLALAGDTITGSPHPAPTAPIWTTAAGSLGAATQGGGFSASLTASSAANFAVRAGLLPWGVTLDPVTGGLSGTLAHVGGPEDDPGPPPAWTTTAGSLGSVREGQAGSFSIAATGAAAYTIVGGQFPWGLKLDVATGAITGTAANVGGGPWEPDVTPVWTAPVSSDLGSYAVGSAISIAQTTVPASAAPMFIISGLLPWGLTMVRGTGAITGTIGAANAPGTYSVTIGAATVPGDTFGQRTYTITII